MLIGKSCWNSAAFVFYLGNWGHQPCSFRRSEVRSDTLKPCLRTRDTSRPGLRHMSSPSFLTEGLEEDTRRHIHREKSISVPGNLFSKKSPLSSIHRDDPSIHRDGWKRVGNRAGQINEIFQSSRRLFLRLNLRSKKRRIVDFGYSREEAIIYYSLFLCSSTSVSDRSQNNNNDNKKKLMKVSLIHMQYVSESWNRWGKSRDIRLKDWRRKCYRPQTNEDTQRSLYLCWRGRKNPHPNPTWTNIIFLYLRISRSTTGHLNLFAL